MIGTRTLEIAKHLQLKVAALAAKSNIDLLEVQAAQVSPELIAVFDKERAAELQRRLPHIPVLSGVEGLKEVAQFGPVDFTMLAMSGSCAIVPTLGAIEAGKQIGLANKEAMISAGELISRRAREKGVDLIPVDSELSALFQCLKGEKKESVRRLILTASGGPFFQRPKGGLAQVTLAEAMVHPHFQMGPKVAINSSTLMNKGLEMIAAQWFYGIDPLRIEAMIHPQQRVHACVEFVDGSILTQMCEPDMRFPIQYALSYPERVQGVLPPYDFFKNQKLEFFPPDLGKFRCLSLAIGAMREGKSFPCFLNGANEVLVERFLKKKISWNEIGEKLEKLISSHDPQNLLTLEAILEVDATARKKASVA